MRIAWPFVSLLWPCQASVVVVSSESRADRAQITSGTRPGRDFGQNFVPKKVAIVPKDASRTSWQTRSKTSAMQTTPRDAVTERGEPRRLRIVAEIVQDGEGDLLGEAQRAMRSPTQTPRQGPIDATAKDAKDYDTRDVTLHDDTLDDDTLDTARKHESSTGDDDHDSDLDPSDDDFTFTWVLVGGLNMVRDVVKFLCTVKFSVFVAILGSVLIVAFSALDGDICIQTNNVSKVSDVTSLQNVSNVMRNVTSKVTRWTPEITCLTSESYWVMALYLYALIVMANDAPPDLVMLGFTNVLIFSKIITDKDAWSGFCSTSILAIASLLVMCRALEETKAVEAVLLPILGNPSNHFSAILRLTLPVICLSAFLNNTPIVAMLMSVCENWAARSNLSVKCLLMPLSYAALLGGCCTLIGTSTNLVLNGLIKDDKDPPMKPFTLFQFSAVGYPGAIAGCVYMAVFVPLYFRPKRAPGAKAETIWSCLNPCYTIPITKNEPTQSTALDLEISGHSMSSMLPVATVVQPAGFGSRGSPRCVVSPLSLSHLARTWPAPRPHLARTSPASLPSHLARTSPASQVRPRGTRHAQVRSPPRHRSRRTRLPRRA